LLPARAEESLRQTASPRPNAKLPQGLFSGLVDSVSRNR
jgi:hypothetical protein